MLFFRVGERTTTTGGSMTAKRIALLAFALIVAAPAAAQQYPNRAIRLIVPAAPGGGTDITARSFVPALQEGLGQPVVIENRGGAGGAIGSDVVAKAAPDGYTLLMCYVSHATNPTLAEKLPYDTLRDFVPITLISHEPTLLVTHPNVAPSTLRDFIAFAKDPARKLNYATDPASAGFLAGELFKQQAGLTHIPYVPYKGSGPAAADVVAGHVPFMWSVISIATPFVRQGRLKALAIASEKRAPGLPDVPTTARQRLVRPPRAARHAACDRRARARRGRQGAAEPGRARAPRHVGLAADRRRAGRIRCAHPQGDSALGEGAAHRGGEVPVMEKWGQTP
jgi:tripartite-type tricarboxylate transporter receptor subunit TctC